MSLPDEPDWPLVIEHLFRAKLNGHEIGAVVGHDKNWVARWRTGVAKRMSWPDGEGLIRLAWATLDRDVAASLVPAR